MEARLGGNFAMVRIHTDGEAAQSAKALHANAYTVGDDIFFGSGRYSPSSFHGRELLAHELAHVVQDRPGNAVIQRSPDSEAELEAARKEAIAAIEAMNREEAADDRKEKEEEERAARKNAPRKINLDSLVDSKTLCGGKPCLSQEQRERPFREYQKRQLAARDAEEREKKRQYDAWLAAGTREMQACDDDNWQPGPKERCRLAVKEKYMGKQYMDDSFAATRAAYNDGAYIDAITNSGPFGLAGRAIGRGVGYVINGDKGADTGEAWGSLAGIVDSLAMLGEAVDARMEQANYEGSSGLVVGRDVPVVDMVNTPRQSSAGPYPELPPVPATLNIDDLEVHQGQNLEIAPVPPAPSPAPPAQSSPATLPPRATPARGPRTVWGPGVRKEPQTAGTGGIQSISKNFEDGQLTVTIAGEVREPLFRESNANVPTPPGRTRAPNFNSRAPYSRNRNLTEPIFRFLQSRGVPNAREIAVQFAEHYEAAHLWGPGLGDEAAAGIMFAPKFVNQELQNRFYEKAIRDLYSEATNRGGTVSVVARAKAFPPSVVRAANLPAGIPFLESMTYEITLSLPSGEQKSVTTTIVVEPPGPFARGEVDVETPRAR